MADVKPLDFKENNVSFALKHHDPPKNLHSRGSSPSQIKSDVLESPRIRRIVREVALGSGVEVKAVEENAAALLDEIGHKMALPALRTVAAILRGVLRNVLTTINVNTDGLNLLTSTLKEWPVVLLPSHRSYLDFILISYVLFEHNITLPCIAAGQDFMSMRGVTPLLRRSGAFFLRRTFGSDKLYKAVFSEYVKTVLCSGDNPMEFFVEGTRSRTGKSLHPRLGLLSMVIEPYLEGRLPDVMVVPISISYERTLEELLFARELLGIPKPKESTTALFKAYNILSEDYGSIYVHFGKPISIHEVCQRHGISRVPHSLLPREDSGLLPEEWKLLEDLGHIIINHTHSGMVIFPTSLVATVLLQHPNGIVLNELAEQVEWVRTQVLLRGGNISGMDKDPTSSGLRMLSAVVKATSSDFIELATPSDLVPSYHLSSLTTINDVLSAKMDTDQFRCLADVSLVHLQLAYYRNLLIHLFLEDAMVALALDPIMTDYGAAQQRLAALHCALACEFVFPKETPSEMFREGVTRFLNRGILCSGEREALTVQAAHKSQFNFLQNLLRPFVSCVWVVCRHLLSLGDGVQTLAVAIKGAQTLAAKCLKSEILNSYEILSLGVIKNALSSLHQAGFILQALNEYGTGKDRLVKVIKKDELIRLADVLGGIVLSFYQSQSKL